VQGDLGGRLLRKRRGELLSMAALSYLNRAGLVGPVMHAHGVELLTGLSTVNVTQSASEPPQVTAVPAPTLATTPAVES
jgi:hypothetical protein